MMPSNSSLDIDALTYDIADRRDLSHVKRVFD